MSKTHMSFTIFEFATPVPLHGNQRHTNLLNGCENPKQMIDSVTANLIIDAARSRAEELGIAVSVAVLDQGANLKAFSRMDRAWLGSIDVAIKKAKSSVLFEVETAKLWEFCSSNGQVHGMESTNGGLVTFAGGLPIKDKDGNLIGAVGVSGGMVDQDSDIAKAASAAFGEKQ